MSTLDTTPTATDILRGLQLLRSPDADERTHGIELLRRMSGDTRVRQVFEFLYENDSDPGVRAQAWQALNAQGPSIPAPVPAAPPALVPSSPQAVSSAQTVSPAQAVVRAPAKTRSATPAPKPISRPAVPSPAPPAEPDRQLFLWNPANTRLVARLAQREKRRQSEGGYGLFVLGGLLMLIIGALWGFVLPDWIDWLEYKRNGVTVEGVISDLPVRTETNGDTYYYAVFQYTLASDTPAPVSSTPVPTEYTARQRISERDHHNLSEGVPVRVTYLPDDPAAAHLKELKNPSNRSRDRLTLGAVALSVVAVQVWLAAIFMRRKRGERPVRGERLILGTVVTCAGTADADDDFYVKIRFRFRTPTGRTITGQASRIRNDLKGAVLPVPDTPVAIHYYNDRTYRLL